MNMVEWFVADLRGILRNCSVLYQKCGSREPCRDGSRGTEPILADKRIGVFGGTFDPVHAGHLIIATEVRFRLGLEQVLFVPADDPPHKPDLPISAASHRVAMLEVAIAGRSEFAI